MSDSGGILVGMAGGMRHGRGAPLGERSVVDGRQPRRPVRHCWVDGAEGPHPGRVLAWRREGQGWSALVVYVAPEGSDVVTVQAWIPAAQLRPA